MIPNAVLKMLGVHLGLKKQPFSTTRTLPTTQGKLSDQTILQESPHFFVDGQLFFHVVVKKVTEAAVMAFFQRMGRLVSSNCLTVFL